MNDIEIKINGDEADIVIFLDESKTEEENWEFAAKYLNLLGYEPYSELWSHTRLQVFGRKENE